MASPALEASPASSVGMSPAKRIELPPTRVPVTVGSLVMLRHLDTVTPMSSLPDAWTQSTARGSATTVYSGAAHQRLVADRFDMAAVATGALAVLAPLRVLPTSASTAPSAVGTPPVPSNSAMTNVAHKGAYVAADSSAKVATRGPPYDQDLFAGASSARPAHALQAPIATNPTSSCGAPQLPVTAVLEPGHSIVWTLHPTHFTMFVVADEDMSASTNDAPFANGPPAHVQLHSVAFSSRCTAACTFTTHSDWSLATGQRRPSAVGATPLGPRSRTTMPHTAWTTATPDRPTRPGTAEVSSVQPQTRHEPVRHLDDTPVFSPAADAENSTSSLRNGSSLAVSAPALPVPPPLDESQLHDLWTAFGFVNGDLVLWNHGQRVMLKRHNSSKLTTRVVGNNASVTAIARVDRSAGGAAGASSSTCSSQQVHHNRMTHVFGDLVVGFDNGSVLIVRLNLTGGFVDEDSVAWLGHFTINCLRPCPVAPQIVAMACGDGALRFLDASTFAPRTAALAAADLGTSRDDRLMCVTPVLSQHGGLSSCDWVSDGSALVTGGQDDAVTYVGVSLFNTGASRTHTPDSTMVPGGVESGGRLVSLTDSMASRPGTAPQQVRSAAPPPAESGRPPPVVTTSESSPTPYMEVHTTVRRPFHRGWVRWVSVVPIATDALLRGSQSPTDDVSVASYDAVNIDGVRDTPSPIEISHLAFCCSEDGTTSVWHLPNADQLAANNSGAVPLLRAPSMTPMGRQAANTSFTPSTSRPTSAGFALGSLAQNLSMTSPGVNQTTPGRWASGGVVGCAVPGVIGRQPSAMLSRLTKSVPVGTSGGGRAVDIVLDDAFLCVVPVPVSSRLFGHGAAVPTVLASATAKGKCLLWSVTSCNR